MKPCLKCSSLQYSYYNWHGKKHWYTEYEYGHATILCNALMELCALRDNITTCDIASITDIIAMIEDIMY